MSPDACIWDKKATSMGDQVGSMLLSSYPYIYIKRASNSIFVINPKVMVGKPVIQGTRLTVEYILGLLAHGSTKEEIMVEYPGLVKDDIYACLLFASKTLQDASFIPIKAEAV
jgi:uncharacterized protein (DUF433 family)